MSTQWRGVLAALAVSIGLAACTDVPSAPVAPAEARVARQGGNGGPIPGQYVVVFRDGVSDAPGLARRLAAAHGGKVHRTYQHAIKGFAASLSDAAVAALRRNPNVAYVEQDQRVSIATAASWGLDRIDQRDLPLDYSFATNRTGAGVTVYILDTGIEPSHWDLGGRVSVGYDAVGDGYGGQDCNGHGTHVAGTVGGNSYGVAKSVSMVSVRVLDCNGVGTWSGVIEGIEWVRNSHAPVGAVANLSLGGGASMAVNHAIDNLVNSGVTVTVAAGNNSHDACRNSPASARSAITVAGTTRADEQASFSNYGSCVDLFAPGEAINSAMMNGSMATLSGTSMAAPHVAGAAALYLEDHPLAAPWEVTSAILSSATPNRLSQVAAGTPNLLLYVGIDPVSPVNPLSAYIAGPNLVVTGTWTWDVYASGGNGTYSYQWQHSRDAGTWTNVGLDSPSHTRYVGSWFGEFYLRVIVTSNGSSYTTGPFRVETDCSDGMC